MLEMEIREDACRGCQMCVDICPTDVFDFDQNNFKAQLSKKDDCIACLSCTYLCPSDAIKHSNYHPVKNFYRDMEFSRRTEAFL